MSLVEDLYFMEDVRAMTPSRFGSRLPSSVMISSVTPSARYSCCGSPLKFCKGRTANMTLFGSRWYLPIHAMAAAAARLPKANAQNLNVRQDFHSLFLLAGETPAPTLDPVLSEADCVPIEAGSIPSTLATNRYPFRETVWRYCGSSVSSPSARRILRTAV